MVLSRSVKVAGIGSFISFELKLVIHLDFAVFRQNIQNKMDFSKYAALLNSKSTRAPGSLGDQRHSGETRLCDSSPPASTQHPGTSIINSQQKKNNNGLISEVVFEPDPHIEAIIRSWCVVEGKDLEKKENSNSPNPPPLELSPGTPIKKDQISKFNIPGDINKKYDENSKGKINPKVRCYYTIDENHFSY